MTYNERFYYWAEAHPLLSLYYLVPMVKSKKKVSRKSLVTKLDTITSLIVRARDKRCVQCGTTENLTCGHLITRSKYATRWDLGNCFGQCASHNLAHEHNSHPFTEWYIDQFGYPAYKDLIRKSWQSHKWTDRELNDLYEQLRSQYEAR